MNENVPEARLAARREETKKSIEKLRKRLLDLSNRNYSMLNFRFSDRSRTHVRVIDELPDVLYGKLVDGKRLTFTALPASPDEPQDEKSDEFLAAFQTACLSDETYLSALKQLGEEDDDASAVQRIERVLKDRVRTQLGLPPRPTRQNPTPSQWARTKAIDPSYDLPRSQQDVQDKATHLDDLLQTLLFPEQMERKLAGIRDNARTALSEMGVNILYAAFGHLEWYENDASDRRFFAPLLLHPVEMGRALVRHIYRYFMTSTGDDSEINLTLKERLLVDFSLALPDFEEDDTPERYFAKVEDAIKDMKRWRVRRFVTIGLFAFGRLAMYHDLDPERWPDNKALHLHPVLVELLGGSDQSGALDAQDYDVDQPDIAAKVPLLITEADSSQFAAIADVMDGKSLAIKGPPGTGKSQTITNIIAAALAKGMKVLFVAEKMAALEVVKKRLDDAGLGEFCLELHSTKARKQDVLESLHKSLDKRLELRRLPEPPGLAETIDEHERLRKQLTRYVELVNQPFGQTGKSLQQLFWAGTRSRMRAKALELPVELEDIALVGALEFASVELDRRRTALTALEMRTAAFAQTYGAMEKHPCAGICRADLSPFEQQELLRALAGWHTAILALEREARYAESECGISAPKTAEAAHRLAKALALLPEDADEIATDILPKLKANSALAALEKFLVSVQSWNERIDSLSSQFEAPTKCLPRVETVWALDAARRELEVGGQAFAGQVGALSELAERYRELARLAERQCAAAKRLFELAGVRIALSAPVLSSLLDAVTLLRSTPREILLKRSPALLDEATRPILNRTAIWAQAIVERHKELARGFSFSVGDSPQGYREHAAALRSVSFLGRLFSSEFRRSHAAWRGLRKSRVKVHPREMAQEADALAEHIEEIQKFHADDRLKAICGTEFEGITTDFNGLLAVNAFARQVENRFPGTTLGNREARCLLLEADRTTFDAVLAEVDERMVTSLRAFLATLEETEAQLDERTELEEACRIYNETAEKAETLYRACKAAGLKDEVALGSLAALVDELSLVAKMKDAVEGDAVVRELLGECFHGTETDCVLLGRTAQFTRSLKATGLPDTVLDRLLAQNIMEKLASLKELCRTLGAALEYETQAREKSLHAGGIDSSAFFGIRSRTEVLFVIAATRIERALAASEELPAWIDHNRLRAEAEEMGLKPILDVYKATEALPKHLDAAFDYIFHFAVLRQAYVRYPELARFSGMTQDAARRRFQQLDRAIIGLQRHRLAAQLACVRISEGINWGSRRTWTNLHLIQHEIGKQKRHIPLRDLLLRAGKAIQEMKPCWMMSPASVAQFVRPGGVTFNLVVIDEASQMKPEDVLGATGRSQQLVVVGDPQQLPPTSFFNRLDMPSDDDDQEDAIDNESILDLALSVFRPARELRWHYRSRHESLIAFSNKHFYDGKLVVFPSPLPRHDDYGVEYRKVDGLYTPKAGVNLLEARAVAEAAEAFMASYPERSLGIVTINQAQREVLTEEMDRLFAYNDHAEGYRKRWEDTLEPFFVKNLENVQGDERDVIFISTVYGPEQRGGRVAQRFGPINAATGHRRLNVLFTRAKEKVIIFSSMTSEDVISTATSRMGVGILKHYLAYARDGRLDSGTPSGRDPDSDFEVFVADRLGQHGFEVVPQVGVAGYFIDLAVRDPQRPDYYLLGIECDGATYHSAKSARDRDRLRQEILEQMGWNIYRIWSTDWFSDPDREMGKLLRHIQNLIQ